MSVRQIRRLVGPSWVATGHAPITPGAVVVVTKSRVSRVRAAAAGSATYARFTPGVVRPAGKYDTAATNVGPRPGTTFTQINGDYTLSAGATVSGLEIWGSVRVAGSAYMSDCIVHGPDRATSFNTSGTSLIKAASGRDLLNATFEWMDLDGSGRESPWTDGIDGGHYTIRYSEISHTNDGIGAMAVGNALVECCRIYHGHYEAWFNTATNAPYPGFPPSPSDRTSHSDGGQFQGYSGWTIRGNYIGGQPGAPDIDHLSNRDPQIPAQLAAMQAISSGEDYANSCLIIQNNVGAANPVGGLFELNWLSGSAARINLVPTAGVDDLSGVIVRNNQFDRSTWTATGNRSAYPNNYILRNGSAATITGNVFSDTGLPVNITG